MQRGEAREKVGDPLQIALLSEKQHLAQMAEPLQFEYPMITAKPPKEAFCTASTLPLRWLRSPPGL